MEALIMAIHMNTTAKGNRFDATAWMRTEQLKPITIANMTAAGNSARIWHTRVTNPSIMAFPMMSNSVQSHRRQPTRLPSLGFSRQEYWSGLPSPSPMHESESKKWKWIRSVVSDSLRPHGLQPIRLLRPWDFPGKSTGLPLPLPSPSRPWDT